MLKEPIIRHSYQFRNVLSSWKVDDDGLSILSGLVVNLYHRILCYDSTGCKKADHNDDFPQKWTQ